MSLRNRCQGNTSFPDVNITVRIRNVFEMIQAVFATWIMCRPVVGACVGLKVVVLLEPCSALGPYEIRTQCFTVRISSCVQNKLIGNIILALGRDILDVTTLQTSDSEFHQTSASFFASDPVVDIWFHHKLVTQALPQVEIHGVVVCLTLWRRGWRVDVARVIVYGPIWTRSDRVATRSEISGKKIK